MPEKGWKTVTLRDEVYERLRKRAEKEHRSVTNMVEVVILEATK